MSLNTKKYDDDINGLFLHYFERFRFSTNDKEHLYVDSKNDVN